MFVGSNGLSAGNPAGFSGGGILAPREEQTEMEPEKEPTGTESVAAAQSDAASVTARTDSVSLSDELAQLKARLDQAEQEKHLEQVWKRKKYWKFGFGNPSIERTDGVAMNWKTQFAFSVQRGKTIYFHSKPLWGMVRFGLDYGFFEMSYAKLKLKTAAVSEANPSTPGIPSGPSSDGGFDDIVSDDPSGSIASLMGVDLGMHKIDFSMHVGPSVSINPWKHLIIAAYFHARPTASGIVENDTFSHGFGCALSAGVSVSYKAFSLGVEGVWSSIKYTQSSFDDEEEEDDGYNDDYADDSSNLFNTEKFKLKQKGPRFYVAVRF